MAGIIIKRLIFSGSNIENSEINFVKGVNAVTGGSGTGKTYIFKCLHFIFGKAKSPAPIKEREPYNSVAMEFELKNGSKYTVRRELKDRSKLEVFRCYYDEIKNKKPEKYSISSQAKKSASTFYMNLFGYPQKLYFYREKDRSTKYLSIRLFLKYFMIDEVRIIDENLSPIYNSKQYSNQPYELEVFKFFMTGKNFKIERSKKTKKGRLKAKNQIEILDIIIIENELLLSDKSKNYETQAYLNMERENLEELETKLHMLQDEVDSLTNEKVKLINENNNFGKIIKNHNETRNRFILLDEQYLSEIERYEFIYEGGFLIEQLPDRKCPVCENKFELDQVSLEGMYEAFNAEAEIVNIKRLNLRESISDISNDIDHYQQLIDTNLKDLKSIQTKIDSITETEMKELKIDIYNLINVEKNKSEIKSLNEELERLKLRRLNLVDKNADDEEPMEDITTEYLTNRGVFCSKLATKLQNWKFDDEVDIIFNDETNDFIINDKKRSDFGKGHRAIIRVAYILTLFDFLQSKSIGVPGFVVIDSPFTTYSGEDDFDGEEVKVSDDVIRAFYHDIVKKYTDNQIIILENDRVPGKLGVNEIHFTRNKNHGRYGLFPND